jgi:hypothetical protein
MASTGSIKGHDNTSGRPAGNRLRSALAVFSGFIAVVALSLGTDQIMHMIGVFPPWDQPMNDVGDNLLALGYRCIYGVVGSYITARLAPHSPMLHVWVGGLIGFALSTAGIVAAINMPLGPLWYPIALTLTTLPCAWLGGILHRAWHGKRAASRSSKEESKC